MAMYDPAYDFYSPEQERRRSLFRWLLIKVLESPAWVEMAPPPESLAGQREAWAEALHQHLLYSFRGARCCDVQTDRYCRVGLVLWQVYKLVAHPKRLQPHEELKPPDYVEVEEVNGK
jgi:hypothetical protein